jgi:hypothetical protein
MFDPYSGITNNLSESMNAVLKREQDWKELPVDFPTLKNRKCDFRLIFPSNSSEGGPVFIFKCGSLKEKYRGSVTI